MANDVLTTHFRLTLNGTDFPDALSAAVEGVTVEDEINLPAMFTISFNIVDFENGRWRGIDLNTFKTGDEIKVFMGQDEAKEMMTGEITSLELTFGSHAAMEIRGYDRLHRLRLGTRRRSFKDLKDSDIASTIASEGGLTLQAEDTGTLCPYLFQNNQSNYEFLIERARRINYELLVHDRNLMFRPSQEDKSPEVSLEFGIDFEDFSVQLKTLTGGSEIEIRGWDVKNKTEITSSASIGSERTTMAGKESGYKILQKAFGDSPACIPDEAIIDAADADTIAKARYNMALREFMTGEGKCSGDPRIRAGKTMAIKGLGDRFSGTYYVVSTTHAIEGEGYTTSFRVRRTGI
jgi:Bacteriophage probable baseplate hub protein